MMAGYIREVIVESCKYGKYGSFESLPSLSVTVIA